MGSLHYRFYAGAIAYLLAARIGLVSVLGHDDEGLSHDHPLFEFQLSNAVLPKPLSDMTATLYGGIVYLAGGCDAPNGNVYNSAIGEFTCDSASDALYAFNYRKNTVEVLATLPRPRYRHAAVAVNDRLWLVGGRTTEDDSIIGQVDVYDMTAGSWRSFDLPVKYYSSDLTGFSHEDLAFFAGGYNESYTTFLATVFAIDTVATLSNSSLVIIEKAPLLVGRGDLSSVTDDDSKYALVTGGFGANASFCAPERAVDLYNFESDTWVSVAPVPIGRADNALVELNGRVFSIGGERQVDNICAIDETNKPEPGEQTVPVDDVVMFDWNTRNWTLLPDLPNHRFRMAAAAVDEINTVFTFGGQTGFDPDCQCFRASGDIMVLKQVTSSATSWGDNAARSWLWHLTQCVLLFLSLV